MTVKQYQAIIDSYIKEHGITVKGYYKTMWGNSSIPTREIWIPKPKTETAFYIALHEIGHIACNVVDSAPTWLHEYSATKWALDAARDKNVLFSKEVVEAIRGYLKYQVLVMVRRWKSFEAMPDKVYKLAGLNKSYCRLKMSEGKSLVMAEYVENFPDFRNLKIRWH